MGSFGFGIEFGFCATVITCIALELFRPLTKRLLHSYGAITCLEKLLDLLAEGAGLNRHECLAQHFGSVIANLVD